MKDVRDRVVLITGAARGMGRLHALTFAREGALVVITDIDATALAATESEMREAGYDVHAYRQDISDREECFKLAARIEEEVGSVDVLINNAAVAIPGTVLEMSESAFRRTTEVNYLGQVWMLQAFVPSMVKRATGHVVNICSGAGKVALPYIGAYSATKFALVGLTDALRQELKRSGVGFTIINPGYIATGMFEGAKPPYITRWLDTQKGGGRGPAGGEEGQVRDLRAPHSLVDRLGARVGDTQVRRHPHARLRRAAILQEDERRPGPPLLKSSGSRVPYLFK